VATAPTIAGLRFPDPDDAMRLLEVRDWLGGQSWWDVGQHRLNGGNFSMHWSRLVDLPLALVMTLVGPLTTPGVADRIAMTIVPLLTLLAVMAGVAVMTRHLAGREVMTLALLMTALSVPLVYQVRPMRIDHHGWQIALAVAAMAALIGRPTGKRGIWAGSALAALVTISLEGFPIAAIITTVAALAWVIEPSSRSVLRSLATSFFGFALVLHVATRGPGAWAASCDAISPAWLAALGVASVGIVVATFAKPSSRLTRLATQGVTGIAAGGTLLAAAPVCARGPFASLDPLVRALWYEQVSEGLPIWEQPLAWAVITVALPVVGIIGTVLAVRRAPVERRFGWQFLLAVLIPAFLLSCLVNRTGATANALALPGAASLLLVLLTRARAIYSVPLRILATIAAFLATSPGLVAAAAALGGVGARTSTMQGLAGASRQPCERFDQVRGLAQLPPGTIFLPIDVTPDLIATTTHRAISGGYHRNAAAMHRVLAAFTGSPAAAERIVRASRADYVAGCAGLNETRLYNAVAPQGLWARLQRGERVAWLQPLPIDGSPVLAWKVVRRR
jgi:hypothetical protein